MSFIYKERLWSLWIICEWNFGVFGCKKQIHPAGRGPCCRKMYLVSIIRNNWFLPPRGAFRASRSLRSGKRIAFRALDPREVAKVSRFGVGRAAPATAWQTLNPKP